MRRALTSNDREMDSNDYLLLDQYESLLTSENLDDLANRCKILTNSLGFENYAYYSHIKLPDGKIFQYIFSDYPDQWVSNYLAAGYITIDPVVEYCFYSNSTTPLFWDETNFDTPKRKELIKEAKGYGIASGLSIPLRGAKNEVALFSGTNPFNDMECRLRYSQCAGDMYVMSSYLHESIRNLVYTKELHNDRPPELTRKEIECLLWWGDGKSANEISGIIGITPRTVRFHLDNVKMKLGVQTKGQVIAKAYFLGLITP